MRIFSMFSRWCIKIGLSNWRELMLVRCYRIDFRGEEVFVFFPLFFFMYVYFFLKYSVRKKENSPI